MSTAITSVVTALALLGPSTPLLSAQRSTQPAVAPAPSEAPPPQPETTLAPAPTEPAPAVEDNPEPPPLAQPTTPAPAAVPVPAPTVAERDPQQPLPEDPPRGRDGRLLLTVGGIMASVGGVSIVFVALPSAIVRNVAQRRADRDHVLAITSRETRYARARRADDAMEAGFWIGAPLVVTGLSLVIVGAIQRSNSRNRRAYARRLKAAPGGMAIHF